MLFSVGLEVKEMQVREFMNTRIECIDADRSVYDAVEIMVDRRFRSLAVTYSGKPSKISFEGVVTARDIVFKVLAKDLNPKKVKVSEIASRPIVCIGQDTNVKEAAALMEKSNIARLYVCDGDKVVGMISMLDIMAAEVIIRAGGSHGS
jgi:CBS domain-containing protein